MTHIYIAIYDHEYDLVFKAFESRDDAKKQLEAWAKEAVKSGWVIEGDDYKAAVKNWDEITEGSEKLLIKRLKVN